MGSWFSNFHIRKREGLSQKQVLDSISSILKMEGYELSESAEDADYGVAVLSGEKSAWFSIHSDAFSFENPREFTKLGVHCGKLLHTEVLGICCADSDFLYLNLLDPKENVDAWVCIGSGAEMGIRRRTGLAAWKKKVDDYSTFRKKVQQKYVCAEEFLREVADCLRLPAEHSNVYYSELGDPGAGVQLAYRYFKMPEQGQKELPKLQLRTYSLMPCEMGKPEVISCVNTGGKSRGLSVYFVGSYVEKEEITFENVQWQERINDGWAYRPIALEKVQLRDGKWAYCGHDPTYLIPPKVNPNLNFKKRTDMEYERSICVRFAPKGNERKRLDIAVVFVPDENPEGQAGWIVWALHGSKREFIRQHNQTWADKCPGLLIREDSVDGIE